MPSTAEPSREPGAPGAPGAREGADPNEPRIVCHLDVLLERRGITLRQLSEQVGVSVVNLSVLKNNRARAVRFSTLAALCEALDCQPGELFSHRGGVGER